MPRVGFIGAECTGKTSVIQIAKNHVKVPVIEELVRDLVYEWGYKKPSEVLCIKAAQRAYLEAQIAKQLELGSFLSDRTPIDSAAYMLLYAASGMSASAVTAFLDRAAHHTKTYDFLVYFPIKWDEVEDDGFRGTDAKLRQDVDDAIVDLINLTDLHLQTYKVQADGPEARWLEIKEELERRKIHL